MVNNRTCAICRVKKPKGELFRFVVLDGALVFDRDQKKLGRGVYFCGRSCWDEAVLKKRKVKIDSKSPKGKYLNLPDRGFDEMTADL